MKPTFKYLIPRALLATVLLTILLSGCGSQNPVESAGFTLDPNKNLDWVQTIGPMLDAYCSSCHAGPTPQSGFSVSSYSSVVDHFSSRGVRIVDPGNPDGSELVQRVEGSGVPQMPPGGNIGNDNIQAIRDWITNGAPEDLFTSGN